MNFLYEEESVQEPCTVGICARCEVHCKGSMYGDNEVGFYCARKECLEELQQKRNLNGYENH